MNENEKDSFGDKLRDKERAEEEMFFAKREREAIEKLQSSKHRAHEGAPHEGARDCCPRDGKRLIKRSIEGVEVEACTACHGIWLAKGELESLSRRESESWLGRFVRHHLVEMR
jgi:TFIIB-like protein